MEDSDRSVFPDYRGLVSVAKHIFTLALEDTTVDLAQMGVEQVRASIRNQFEAVGLDPQNIEHLQAALIGALVAIHVQVGYSQIGTLTATIPASIVDMITNPIDKEERSSMEHIAQMLNTDGLRRNRLEKFLRGFFRFD